MRQLAWIALSLAVACAKGGEKDKPASGSANPAPAPAPAPAPSGKAEETVTGTLALGGALTASVSWKPDLNLTCACIDANDWNVDVTMSDGADTFVAVTLNAKKGITLTSGKLKSAGMLRSEAGAGMTGSCKPDGRNVDGVMSIDLDGKVTGDGGEVTVKGHLDVTCRSGL